jgi:hypothetical protein
VAGMGFAGYGSGTRVAFLNLYIKHGFSWVHGYNTFPSLTHLTLNPNL